MFFLTSCDTKHKNTTALNDTLNISPILTPDSVNPNGSSELALLMRTLEKTGERNKVLLISEKSPEKWPENRVEKLLTATPTDDEIKGTHYDAFALDFIAAVQNFNKSDKKSEAITLHNRIIGVCMSCHEQSCAGPMVRIKKLFVN